MDRKELLEKLTQLKPGLATNKMIPIFSYFMFKDNEIRSFNGYEGIIVRYEHDLDCCLEGDLLVKLLSSYSTTDIDITVTNGIAKIVSGKSKSTVPALPSADFIFNETITQVEPISFTLTENFMSGLKKSIKIASTEKIQENKNGVTLITDATNLITMYATNGKTVSKYKSDLTCTLLSTFFPLGFCDLLINFNTQAVAGTVSIDANKIVAIFGDITVLSLVKDMDLLAYEEKVFSNYDLASVTMVDKDGLETVIKRATIFFSDIKGKVMNFDCDGVVVTLNTKESTYDFTEELEIPLTVSKFSLDLNELVNILPLSQLIGVYLTGPRNTFVCTADEFLTVTGII